MTPAARARLAVLDHPGDADIVIGAGPHLW